MTQFFTYDGVDLGATTVRLEEGVPGFTSNADGSFGVGGLRIDDPAGALTFTQLQEFSHTETACSQPRTFTGYLWNMRVGRGPYRSGAGRVYDFDFADLNWLLTLQPLRGATAKRPVETGDARLAWLLASVALDGIVFDNGFVGNNPNNFDEADYRNQLATDVLSDLCVSSSADTGRIFFVYRDNASGEPSLFIDRPTVAVYDSTLEISNNLSDVDNVTTFAPYMNVELEAGGEEIYCSVFFVYKSGQIYRHSATTHATYFAGSGLHRQAVFTTDRIGSLATATRHADAFLAAHAGTLDTLTVPIKLPAAKANLIEAGMRVRCKFVHLPGFESYGYLRVAQRTIALTPGTNDHYDLTLKLTNRTTSPVGGGDPGDFPHASGDPLLVATATGYDPAGANATTRTATLAAAPLSSDVLVAFASMVEDFAISWPVGWTVLGTGGNPGQPSRTSLAVRTGTTDPAVTVTAAASARKLSVMVAQVRGVDESSIISALGGGSGTTGTLPSLTPTTGANILLLAFTFARNAFGVTSPPTDMTTQIDLVSNDGGASVRHNLFTRAVEEASGSYGPSMTYGSALFDWEAAHVAAIGTGGGPPPPGTWVYDEVPTPTPDGTTTTFTLAYAFADGSLIVKVDRLDQTAAVTSYDGAARTFVLGFAPKVGELVEVSYQGR